MGQVHATEVDGVRTFWVDSGRPTLMATLIFRAGRADEVLATSGWLHLLEHLALHGLHRGSLAVNGSVSTLDTTFSFHGPAEQVVGALEQVTRRLAVPELAELERERRVLAAEAATRGGPVHRAFGQRYGARGPGLAAYDDVALGRTTPELLRGVAQWAFAAGNGALALDGPPPPGLRLHLEDGTAGPTTPRATAVEKPRRVYAEPAGLVLSGTVTRSGANTFAAHVLEDALRRKLREQDGTSYAPYSLYEAIDADHALVVAGADVSPTTTSSLLGNVLDLTDGLAKHGPDPEAVADGRAAARQAHMDPYNIGFLAHRAAARSLWGRPVEQLEDVVAEHDAITVNSLVPALTEIRDSLIVGAPAETAPHTRLRLIEQPQSGERGRGARSANWPADASRLAVTESAVTVGDPRGHVSYPLDEVAGYLVWDNGSRGLVLTSGWGFSLHPDAWHRGEDHVRRLDELVSNDLHLPQPAATTPEPVSPAPMARRWWLGMLRWFGGPVRSVLVLLGVLWCLYAVAQGVYLGEPAVGLVFVPVAAAVVWFFHVPQRT